jgi:hypothetical protein
MSYSFYQYICDEISRFNTTYVSPGEPKAPETPIRIIFLSPYLISSAVPSPYDVEPYQSNVSIAWNQVHHLISYPLQEVNHRCVIYTYQFMFYCDGVNLIAIPLHAYLANDTLLKYNFPRTHDSIYPSHSSHS